jgi:Amt family ammonium transporter
MLLMAGLLVFSAGLPIWAQEAAAAPAAVPAAAAPPEAAAPKSGAYAEDAKNIDILWTCLAAFLVFFMQAGFAMVESGFTRAKNAVNIMMKNLLDFSVGSLAFFFIGFGIMFGAGNGWFGSSDLFMLGETSGGQWGYTFFIFQAVFAATAATIVSGGVAGRTKFTGYLAYSVVICAIIYPVFGSWAWGGLLDGKGWLEEKGFLDFAGSTVVHSVGAWLALAGAIVLGPRIGKFGKDGKPKAIPGHNIPLAALGVIWPASL